MRRYRDNIVSVKEELFLAPLKPRKADFSQGDCRARCRNHCYGVLHRRERVGSTLYTTRKSSGNLWPRSRAGGDGWKMKRKPKEGFWLH